MGVFTIQTRDGKEFEIETPGDEPLTQKQVNEALGIKGIEEKEASERIQAVQFNPANLTALPARIGQAAGELIEREVNPLIRERFTDPLAESVRASVPQIPQAPTAIDPSAVSLTGAGVTAGSRIQPRDVAAEAARVVLDPANIETFMLGAGFKIAKSTAGLFKGLSKAEILKPLKREFALQSISLMEINRVNEVLKSNVRRIGRQMTLKGAARQGTLAARRQFGRLIHGQSRAFEKDIAREQAKMVARGEKLQAKEARSIIEKSLKKAETEGITEGPVVEQLKFELSKLSPKPPQISARGAGGARAQQLDLPPEILKQVSEQTGLKEPAVDLFTLSRLRTAVRSAESSAFQSGRKLANIDNHVANIFRNELGKFVAKRSPGFQQTSSVFQRAMEVEELAVKHGIVEGRGLLQTKKFSKFLEDIATGNVTEDDLIFLRRLEGGIGGRQEIFRRGVGDISKKARAIGERMRILETRGELTKQRAKELLEEIASIQGDKTASVKQLFRNIKSTTVRLMTFRLLRRLLPGL